MTSTEPPATTAPAPPPGPRQVVVPKRARDTVFDMIRSLGLIALIVAVSLIFVPNLIHPDKASRMQPVDYTDTTVGFHQVTGKAALVPVGLPSGWYANGAMFSRAGARTAHVHIGWVTPDKNYAALEESDAPAAGFVASILGPRGATATGQVTIAGTVWSMRTSQRGERSLSTTLHGVTVVITGSASEQQEQELAGSLHPGGTRVD